MCEMLVDKLLFVEEKVGAARSAVCDLRSGGIWNDIVRRLPQRRVVAMATKLPFVMFCFRYSGSVVAWKIRLGRAVHCFGMSQSVKTKAAMEC